MPNNRPIISPEFGHIFDKKQKCPSPSTFCTMTAPKLWRHLLKHVSKTYNILSYAMNMLVEDLIYKKDNLAIHIQHLNDAVQISLTLVHNSYLILTTLLREWWANTFCSVYQTKSNIQIKKIKELIATAKTSLDVFKQIVSISTRQTFTLRTIKTIWHLLTMEPPGDPFNDIIQCKKCQEKKETTNEVDNSKSTGTTPKALAFWYSNLRYQKI